MIKKRLKQLNRRLATHFGVMLVSTKHLYPWQLGTRYQTPDRSGLPAGAEVELLPSNRRLHELEERYRNFDQRVTHPFVWREGKLTGEDLLFFRGDNPYVWQSRDTSEVNYALAYYYSLARDPDLVSAFKEDGAFGAHTYLVDARLVSRDLLDSIQEISFLRRHVGLGTRVRKVLDIGAGYGRLAHRLSEAFAGALDIYATDAFAPSTFLCEYYLRYREAAGTRVVPLDEVGGLLQGAGIQVATNIHSFSECSSDAIDWWCSRIAASKVPYLFVIPNRVDPDDLRCLTNDGRDMEQIFEQHGYRLMRREPRYADPLVQKYGVDPSYLALFELQSGAGT